MQIRLVEKSQCTLIVIALGDERVQIGIPTGSSIFLSTQNPQLIRTVSGYLKSVNLYFTAIRIGPDKFHSVLRSPIDSAFVSESDISWDELEKWFGQS